MCSKAIVQYTASSSHPINRYDVFVSFRGKDTRNNFTGFLFEALRRKGIDAFKDDEDLKKGESIAPELLHAIQSSRLFIVVFSKNYASSTWCLRELAEIRNCVQTSPRPVIPVFYDVDPSVVRKQSECYENAFAEHEKRFREDKAKMEEAERWREALRQVANLSGWDIRNKLRNVRALVVLDNVDEVEQLRMFTGKRDTLLRECLGGGSRIILVSRDEHILRTHGVDDIYQVQPLNRENAMQLFCRNAFKVNHILSDYEKLARGILSHAQDHPLAIEVIGSSLFGRNVSQWESALARLKEKKSKNIMDVLRLSFDQLDEDQKETFLDIASVLCNHHEKYVKEVLNFRGFHAEYSLQVLLDKSLIVSRDGFIHMHCFLKDLAEYIVKEESPKEPLKRSRLWDYQDFRKAMSNNETTEILEVVAVHALLNSKTVRVDGLSKIRHLKYLRLKYVNCSGRFSHLSSELGYLDWNNYPFECLPQSFQPHKLVELLLRGSSIQRLWSGTKVLPNLKHLDLSYSEKLVEMPDVAEALNLEGIELEGCIQLRKLSPSIGLLSKLTILNLKNCENLSKCLTSLSFLTHLGSIIPGREIPMWFNNQLWSNNNSIIINVTPFVHYDNWVGVVCCAILSYETRFLADLRRMNMDNSNCMWLFYYSRQQFYEEKLKIWGKLGYNFKLRFKISDDNGQFAKFEVEKYGYRWVNEQDLQLSTSAMNLAAP
ncbi:hypothetical protein LR48_Vigan08g113800 [Vigna angularis]|uniref:TIR domain-containing protein n=1 Tax=Phaseolus angularis TaxID=3914 RepID=A0A0L9V5J2_PHAAN|nr:hypothetical protein LR48_Vigan08g113800 [Vigna angularis]